MQRFPRLASISATIAIVAIALPASSSKSAMALSTNLATNLAINSSLAFQNQRLHTKPYHLSQTPVVLITGAADAVAKFNASQQLYIQGSALTPEQINRLLTTLNANPNVFVVIMDYSADAFADDETLSRGIANSAAFESVVNEATGERQGVLLMVYFDSDQGRMISMRSEELPDRLGVGETNFADENDNPKELLNLFLNATHNEGKDLPGALEVLINRINGTIRQQVTNTIDQAQQTIVQAATALAGFPVTLGQFRSQFQVGGSVGNPNVALWELQLDNARKAIANNNFAEAQKLAQAVTTQISQQEEAMGRYGQAPEIAAQVQQTLDEGAIALTTIPDGPSKQQATQLLNQGQTQLQQFQTQYQTGQIEFWNSLQSAQASSQALVLALDQVRSNIRQVQRQRLVIALVVLSMLVLISIALFIKARNARIDAQKVLRQAKRKIAERTKALFKLMDDAEYHSFKTYTGHTQQHAHTMLGHITDAITLVGGTDVVLAEAERLVTSGHLTNRFFTGSYKRAIALLTDEKTALPLEKVKSLDAVLNSQETAIADVWRSHLSTKQTTEQTTERNNLQDTHHSFQNILDLMTEHREQAVALLEELIKKDSGIADYFNQIEAHAHTTQTQAQTLQSIPTPQIMSIPQTSQALSSSAQGGASQDPDSWFKVPTVQSTLIPLVTASGGYLAKGRQSMATDPIMAWDHYGDGGDRIAQEARQMIELGTDARNTLLRTLAHADSCLHPHQVSTDWAYSLVRSYSQRLEQLAKDASQNAVEPSITTLDKDVDELDNRLQTVIRQDDDRRTIALQQIQKAEANVASYRQRLWQTLKSLSLFQSGQPDQVLRESDTDPSVPITTAKQHWQSLKNSLERGNVEESQAHLDQIATKTQLAHQWVRDTQAAIQAYPLTLQSHKDRVLTLHRDRQTHYIPILQTMRQQYESIVLDLIAPEVNAGQTIADNGNHAQNLITKATETLKTAVSQMNTAHILAAQTTLNTADRLLTSAYIQLYSIEQASQILAQRQESVGIEYEALRNRCVQTQRDLQASYVRSSTERQWEEVKYQLDRLRDSVRRVPFNPYAASEDLQAGERLRQRLGDAIATDKRTFEKAKSTIRRAESAIQSAENDIHSASQRHFRYATVNTSSAQSQLRDAERDLREARRSLQSQHYETSTNEAQSAISDAKRASHEANDAVSRARRAHNAEQQRRNRAASTSSYSSFSSSSSHASNSSSSSNWSSSSSSGSSRSSSSGSRGGSW
ncbi:MAG: hypothetical protein AAGD25_04830 [Cyanobacteria bacterium P01_F01_bin.150]